MARIDRGLISMESYRGEPTQPLRTNALGTENTATSSSPTQDSPFLLLLLPLPSLAHVVVSSPPLPAREREERRRKELLSPAVRQMMDHRQRQNFFSQKRQLFFSSSLPLPSFAKPLARLWHFLLQRVGAFLFSYFFSPTCVRTYLPSTFFSFPKGMEEEEKFKAAGGR